MTLSWHTPQLAEVYLNLLLYGSSGSGKTFGAFTAPGPIFYVGVEGENAGRNPAARAINAGKRVAFMGEPASWRQALDDIVAEAYAGRGKTLIIDSIPALYAKLLAEFAGGPTRKPQIQHFGGAEDGVMHLVRRLRDAPINVVLISHEILIDARQSDGETVFKVYPAGGTSKPKVGKSIAHEVDVVAYCQAIGDETKTDVPMQYLAQLVPAKGREAKTRTVADLGRLVPIDISAWLAAEAAAVAATTSKEQTAA